MLVPKNAKMELMLSISRTNYHTFVLLK